VLNTEIWKKLDDLPYEISQLGNFRRCKGSKGSYKNKELVKPYINNKGYLCVHAYKNSKMYGFSVHRLIAIYFIPNPDKLPEVNHKDGNPLNNEISNLEWCTHQYNMAHSWNTGLHKNYHANASVKRKGATSTYKGVSWSEERQRWCVGVGFNKKRYSGGRFVNEVDAAKAYDNLINKLDLQKYGYKPNFS